MSSPVSLSLLLHPAFNDYNEQTHPYINLNSTQKVHDFFKKFCTEEFFLIDKRKLHYTYTINFSGNEYELEESDPPVLGRLKYGDYIFDFHVTLLKADAKLGKVNVAVNSSHVFLKSPEALYKLPAELLVVYSTQPKEKEEK